MTEFEITIPRPKRWDEPFGADTTASDVEALLRIEPFCNIDQSAFPPNLPLFGILRNDTRLKRFAPGEIVVREGDYGNSAFLIVNGQMRVVVARLDPTLLGRADVPRPSWRSAIAQLWRNSRFPEERQYVERNRIATSASATASDRKHEPLRVFLQDVPRLLESTGTVTLGAGEIFGELAALSRTPRTATVIADTAATLVEIRWQGLRDLMKRAPALRQHVERLYRENSLLVHLRETPLLRDLPTDALERVSGAATFESYGNFDWFADFHKYRESEPAERIAAEPVICTAGEAVDGLRLIRAGFARVSRKRGQGEQTVAYLGKGQAFGFTELLEEAHCEHTASYQSSLRAVGYVDIIHIPKRVVLDAILPHYKEAPSRRSTATSTTHRQPADASLALHPRTLDFLADHRFLNGTQTMLILLDRCTRCDDCVRACAAAHDNNPRFVRQGTRHDNLMIADACMQCVDPVCLIGCPTGAIARDEATGIVRINDPTCIGCATCASSCPYNAIGMVEIRDSSGAFLLDQATQQPILKATKCDLCADQITGPACQQACPHDALIRADMSALSSLTPLACEA